MRTVTVGSQEWCDDWAAFYLKKAEKCFNREWLPEKFVWEDLLNYAMWKYQEPWVKEKS